MSNNYDLVAFREGFESTIQLSKEAGWGDSLWNNTLGMFGQHGTGRKMVSDGLQWAGSEMGKGAVNGGTAQVKENIGLDPNKGLVEGTQKAIGWDATKGLGDNVINTAQKAFGWDTSKGWGDNISNNPIKSGLLGAGALAGGYGLGKAFGLWGGDNNGGNGGNGGHSCNHGPGPNNNFSSAYTTGLPNAPQALQKASELQLPPGVKLPTPEFKIPSVFGPSITAAQSIYSMMNPDPPEQQVPPVVKQDGIRLSPEDASAEKALANPKMRAYISSLVRDTYSR